MKKRSKNGKAPEALKHSANDDLMIRAATIEVRAADGDAPESVVMSVSSELPVLTYVYFNDRYQQAYEILDHSPSSVDMSRCKDGLVILDRHYGDQIGLMNVRLKDGKISGPVEFCSGERAQEISKDAAKGLRRNVSVGYMVRADAYQVEGDKDGIPVVRAMSWMPYEASFEPVPADTSVGVNRSQKVEEPHKAAPVKKEERKMTIKEFGMLVTRGAKYGIGSDKVEALVNDDSTMESVRAALDSLIVEKQEADLAKERKSIVELKERKPDVPVVGKQETISGSPESDAKILRKYSVMNVIRSLSGSKVDVGMEREVSGELAKQRGKEATGIIIPHAALAKRDFTVSGTSSASVATDLLSGEFIELLRTRSVLGAAGVRFLTGLVGDLAIPKMTVGATGYWVSEGVAVTESQPTLGQVTGTPHTCGVMTDISRKLILQSSPAAEMMVRDEIIERIIRTIQIAVFAGTGADGQPSAITNATGINNPSVTAGTPTYAEILSFIGDIEADNASADSQAWIMTSEVMVKLAATMRTATYGDIPLLDPASPNMLGRPYFLTEDVTANSLWFGNWSTVNIGVWGNGIDINVDTSTLSSSGGVRLVGLQDVDVMVRQGKALAYNEAVTS